MEENKERITEENAEQKEGTGLGTPDFDRLLRSVKRICICVVILIVGILLIVFAKRDLSMLLVGIACLVIAALLFRIAMKGVAEYKKKRNRLKESLMQDENNSL